MRRNILLTLLCIFSLFVMVGCNLNDFIPDSNDNTHEEETNDSEQRTIYNLAVESGYKGTYEEWLNSIKGDQVVLQVSNGYIQWKYSEDTTWKNLISLSDLTGTDGEDAKNVEFKVNDGFLQWRYVGEDDINWRMLLNLSTLTGSNGKDGKTPEFRVSDGYIQWKYTNETVWTNLITLSTLTGDKGEDGLTPEFRASETHILWKYTVESDTQWRELIAFANLKGEQGPQGVPGIDGHTPEIIIGSNGNWYVDDVDTGIKAQGSQGVPGQDGRSVVSITLTSSNDNVDTYTILYSDNTTSTFTVTNGKDGQTGSQGIQGPQGVPGQDGHTPEIIIGSNGNWYVDNVDTGIKAQGAQGVPGQDGRSVVSITLTSSNDNVDTYTILYSDNITSTFTVTNGKDGQTGSQGIQGIQGIPGEDGHTPVITIQNGYWHIDGVNTNVLAEGVKGETGSQGAQGEAGKSVYETFKEYYPDYSGTEKDWITDVITGNVCNLIGHKWDEGEITLEPQKGVDGEKTYTCETCGGHKYEVIPMIEVADAEIYEVDGIKYVNYGSYPQTHVGDETLIAELNKLTETNARGYYEYNGKEYAKVTAKPDRYGTYKDAYGNTLYYEYSDGSRIQKNTIEWFVVEPIQWRIISENGDGSYQLYSEYILDATKYYNDLYLRSINGVDIAPNNYKYSNIRAWLNGYDGTEYKVSDYENNGFLQRAFKDNEKGAIITKEVDNSASTTVSSSNQYACENTNDKMYLLSCQDMCNSNYGFTGVISRYAQVTDYAKAVGARWDTSVQYLDNGYYWLRSPDGYNSDVAYCVYRDGNFSYDDVYYSGNGVRVACTINLE